MIRIRCQQGNAKYKANEMEDTSIKMAQIWTLAIPNADDEVEQQELSIIAGMQYKW